MTGIKALLTVMRDKFLVLITCSLLGAAAAGVINMLLPVVYEASAKLVIAAPYWNDSTALVDPNVGGGKTLAYGDEFTQQRMESYARLVTTPLVADRVVRKLRLADPSEDVAAKLSSHIIPETVMLEVRAEDASPARAATLANAAAEQTIEVVKDVERPPYSVVSPVQPVLFESASIPSRPISPRTLVNTVCGAIGGFLLGLTYIATRGIAREGRLLARLRDDGATAGESGVLGVFAAEDHLRPADVRSEAKFLRLEVAHGLAQAGVQSLMMTSPRANPATGIVAALLAAAFSEAGAPTVVVFADFTAEHHDSAPGLGDLLCKPVTVESVIQSDERSGFSWISAGTAPENPTRDLTGPKMHNLLIDLRNRYRHVIVVSPPTLELADAVDTASLIGASVLVDVIPEITAQELRESERLLRLAQGAYLGRVVVAGGAIPPNFEMPEFGHRNPAAMR